MKLEIEVSENKLVQIKRIVKELNNEVQDLDPLKFLKAMFEIELSDLGGYLEDTCFDGGGNGIGDILSEDEREDIIVFKEGYDKFGNCTDDRDND